jgi:hypothetical protein
MAKPIAATSSIAAVQPTVTLPVVSPVAWMNEQDLVPKSASVAPLSSENPLMGAMLEGAFNPENSAPNANACPLMPVTAHDGSAVSVPTVA